MARLAGLLIAAVLLPDPASAQAAGSYQQDRHDPPHSAVRAAGKARYKATQRAAHRAAVQRGRAVRAVRWALRQRGKPYIWGADGPRGFDCSGLAQQAWRRAGVRIPRVAAAQYRRIAAKIGRRRLAPGDLVFFHGLGHVAVWLGGDFAGGRFVHAPRTGDVVRIARMDRWRRASFDGAVRPGIRPQQPHSTP